MNLWLSPLLAQDAAKTTETVAKAVVDGAKNSEVDSLAGLWILLVLLAIVVLPFVVGNWLAGIMKVRDLGSRISTVLLALVIGFAPFVAHKVSTDRSLMEVFSYGIDLAGGFNLVYAVDKAALGTKPLTTSLMQDNLKAIAKRVNPSGTEEVSVRIMGSDKIEVIIPGADAAKMLRIKNQITNLGELEFCLLANREEFSAIVQYAEDQQATKGTGLREVIRNGALIAKWRPMGIDSTTKAPKDGPGSRDMVTRQVERGGQSVTEYLLICEPDPDKRITGELLSHSSKTTSDDGGLAVSFTFGAKGSRFFGNVTGAHLPRTETTKTHLAILLNEEMQSAPTIDAKIDGQGQISGSFTLQEVEELVAVLNAGAMTLPLFKQPVNEFAISPLLGIEIRKTGLMATLFSMAAVFVITAFYYRKAGLIADLCLLLNLLLLLSSMALIDATLTLPGIAGIVLSVAMAVDANVLIFERMREELAKGSSMRMCIKNGFDKALGTIIDSNMTTLISAVVLYYVGTDQVKGFAVTLFLGIVISMFTEVFVARLIFELLERKGILKSLSMYNIIKQTNFDFVGKTRAFLMASCSVIGLGLLVVAYRGQDNLDIDFRGGGMVTFRFEGNKMVGDIEAVRAPLVKAFNDSISLERLLIQDEQGQDVELFRMRTVTDREEAQLKATGASIDEQLRAAIRGAFAETPMKLVQQSLAVGESELIAATTRKLDDVGLLHEKTFEGGRQFSATVGQALTPAALGESVKSALKDIGAGVKYNDTDDLVDVQPADAAADAGAKSTALLVRLSKGVEPADAELVSKKLLGMLDGQPLLEELTNFSASVAGDTQIRAVLAIVIAMVAITAYLWFRFAGMTFGIAASIALIHDIAFTLGAVAVGAYLSRNSVGQALHLVDFKLNLTMIAAFLTIIGYSLNDTIVVFDRIREVRGKNPKITWEMVNISLNQTLSRTLLTSVTTIITSIILYFFGGEGLRGFSYCLTIGILVGTYSSIYIASPALVWIMNREQEASKKAAAALLPQSSPAKA